MESTELGYVLFSARILNNMRANPSFAQSIGKLLGKHLEKEAFQGLCQTDHGQIAVLTQLDKNKMPRTTVALREEIGK